MVQKNKGITLIALVVTIIILLILAAVTIATLTGENGLFARAKEAKEVTEETTVREEFITILLEYNIEKVAEETPQDLSDFLISKGADNVLDNQDGTYTVEFKGYEFILDGETLEIIEQIKIGKNNMITDGLVDYWKLNNNFKNSIENGAELGEYKGTAEFKENSLYLNNSVIATQQNYKLNPTYK